jgi:adenylate cyclase
VDRTREIDVVVDHHEQSGDYERHRQRGVKRFTSAARELNRHPRLVASARGTREWMMGDDQIADRLAATASRPADLVVRQLAALESESRGVVGELGLAVLQGWQRVAESRGRGRSLIDVAVLFTDLVGFSDWALQSGDEQAIRLLREVSGAIEPPILERRGEIVKRLGDGLMAVFRDAQTATEAAFDARERAALIEVDGYRPRLRTGIHLGRPRKIGGDYLGIDVNIAARLLEAAKPGEILVSDRTLQALDADTVTARKRRFHATGVPSGLAAHVVERAALATGTPGRASKS